MRFKFCVLLAFLFISCQNLNGEYMSPEINEFPAIEGNNLNKQKKVVPDDFVDKKKMDRPFQITKADDLILKANEILNSFEQKKYSKDLNDSNSINKEKNFTPNFFHEKLVFDILIPSLKSHQV